MSAINLLIIEPDLEFTQKIVNSLQRFNFHTLLRTDVSEPDDLLNIPIPIHSLILNLELKSMEGLALYSYLKAAKPFRKTTFTFLADDNDIFCLLENMTLERSVILNKKRPIDNLIQSIIDNIPISGNGQFDSKYITDLTGKTSQLSLKELLLYCEFSKFTGFLLLEKQDDFATVELQSGQIGAITYQNYQPAEALKLLETWTDARFRLERRKYGIADIKRILSENNQQIESPTTPVLDKGDVFMDLFNFLFKFLSEQIPPKKIISTFEGEIRKFKEKFPRLSSVKFNPDAEEVIEFVMNIEEQDEKALTQLLYSIFSSAKSFEPELDFTDFLVYVKEIEPYLQQINFYHTLESTLNIQLRPL